MACQKHTHLNTFDGFTLIFPQEHVNFPGDPMTEAATFNLIHNGFGSIASAMGNIVSLFAGYTSSAYLNLNQTISPGKKYTWIERHHAETQKNSKINNNSSSVGLPGQICENFMKNILSYNGDEKNEKIQLNQYLKKHGYQKLIPNEQYYVKNNDSGEFKFKKMNMSSPKLVNVNIIQAPEFFVNSSKQFQENCIQIVKNCTISFCPKKSKSTYPGYQCYKKVKNEIGKEISLFESEAFVKWFLQTQKQHQLQLNAKQQENDHFMKREKNKINRDIDEIKEDISIIPNVEKDIQNFKNIPLDHPDISNTIFKICKQKKVKLM